MGSRQQGRSFQGELAPTTLLTPEAQGKASGGGGQAGELVPPVLTSAAQPWPHSRPALSEPTVFSTKPGLHLARGPHSLRFEDRLHSSHHISIWYTFLVDLLVVLC